MAKPPSPECCSIIHPSISSSPYSPACTGGPRTHLRFMSPPPELEHPPRLRHELRVCLFGLSCQVPQLVQRSLMAVWARREAAGRICPAASLSSSDCVLDTRLTLTSPTTRLTVHRWEFAHVLLLWLNNFP